MFIFSLRTWVFIQFFGGVIFFAFIANFIPEPSLAPSADAKNKKVKYSIFPVKIYAIALLLAGVFTFVLDNRNMGMKGAKISWKSIVVKFYLVELSQQ